MAKPISISVGADTRDAAKGIKSGILEPMEDVQDILKAVNKTSLDGLEGDLRDASKKTEALSDKLDDARLAVSKTSRAGRDIGDGFKKGTQDVSEGVETMKENLGSNAKEMAASFDGSVDGMVDGVQGLIAEMTEGFGPAGLAAGVIAAAGIGLVVAQGQKAADALNEAKERAGALALEIIDADGDLTKVDIAGKMREWGVEIADNVEWWELWQTSATTNLEKAEKAAKDFGIEFKDMFKAMSGMDPEAARRVLRELNGDLEALQAQMKKNAKENPFAGFSDNAALDFQTTALRNQISELERMSGVSADATSSAERLKDMTADLTAQQEAATRAEEARTSAINALQGELDESLSSFDDFKDKETGALDPAGFVENMRVRREAVSNFNTNVQTISQQFGLTQEETQALLDQGLNFAPMLQSIIDSGLQGEFADQVRQSVNGGQSILDGTPLTSTVQVSADEKPATKSIRQLMDEDRKTEVKVDAKTTDADKQLDAVVSKDRVATIRTSVSGLGSIESQLDRAARDRALTYTVRFKDEYGRRLN